MTDFTRTQQSLNRAGARAAMDAAIAKAEQMDVPVNIAVVDAGGHPLAFERMDGAQLISADIAQDKAYTVIIGNGVPTSQWYPAIDQVPALRLGFPHRDRLVIFGGGVPITIGDEVVGAIGVSGGTAEEDAEIATAGAEVLR